LASVLLALIAGAAVPVSASAQQATSAGYYDFALYPTARGGHAAASIRMRTAASPFTLAVTVDGHVIYDIRVEAHRLRPSPQSVYIAWAAPPNLDTVERIGVLDDNLTTTGRVHFNKFIVFVTESPSADAATALGDPIVLRGTSRSGRMRSIFDHSDIVGEEP